MNNPFPKEIRRLGIAAPAGRCDTAKLAASLKMIRSFGIEPVLPGQGLFASSGMKYLAAPDQQRAELLNQLIRDGSIDAIQCVRGGYGTPRILPLIDWDAFQKRPALPLIGFSDITALHMAMLSKHAGIPVAAQMTAALSVTMNDRTTYLSMKRALSMAFHGKAGLKKYGAKLTPFNKALDVQGPLITGNLSLVASLCGTPYLPDFTGTVLVLEDIGEQVRLLDRHLNQLLLSGKLENIAALVFGQFTDCQQTAARNRMLRSFAEKVKAPVFSGLCFGHDIPSYSFVCGENSAITKSGDFLI